jgi:LPXTG-motif cell wall-anchored protein
LRGWRKREDFSTPEVYGVHHSIGSGKYELGYERVHYPDYPGSELGEHTKTGFYLGPCGYYSFSETALWSTVLGVLLALALLMALFGVRRKKRNPTM